MERQVAVRRARIAASALFGVLTVLLVALWVRSYWWRDNLFIEISQLSYAQYSSEEGESAFLVTHSSGSKESRLVWFNPWELGHTRIEFFPFNGEYPRWMGFDMYWIDGDEWGIFVPHWFVCLLTGAIAVMSANTKSKRFSIRTMLIAVTLVAIMLGLGAWIVR